MILRTNQNRGNNFSYTDNAGYWFKIKLKFVLFIVVIMGALSSVQRTRLDKLADDDRTVELKAGFCNADPITTQG